MQGHTAFVFSSKAIQLGHYLSGGQDKCLKIWEGDKCVQDIQQPGSIWSITFDENKDIFVAQSDGVIRVFSTNEGRRADVDVQ